MKLNVRGDKIIATPAIKEYVAEKLTKLDKYFENPEEVECKVLVRVRNNLQTIEVTIPMSKFIIRAEVGEKDLYAAIDLVVDKLESQIRKNKSKINSRYKKFNDFELTLVIDDNDEKVEEEIHDIVKRKTVDAKPMDEEEALLQMRLLNHDFFIFKNIDEECVSVIYKRKDNKFGIINMK